MNMLIILAYTLFGLMLTKAQTTRLISLLLNNSSRNYQIFPAFPELFAEVHKFKKIMTTLDAVNDKLGSGTLTYASQGTTRPWKMKCELRTPKYTTSWKQLVQVRQQPEGCTEELLSSSKSFSNNKLIKYLSKNDKNHLTNGKNMPIIKIDIKNRELI